MSSAAVLIGALRVNNVSLEMSSYIQCLLTLIMCQQPSYLISSRIDLLISYLIKHYVNTA